VSSGIILLDELGNPFLAISRCPFCGGEGFLLTDQLQPHMHRVQCSSENCSACTAWWNWKKDAIEAWNKRN